MIFVLGLGSVLLLAHAFLFRRLVWCTGTDRRWRIGGGVVLGVLFIVLLTSLAFQRTAAGRTLRTVHLVGMSWLAVVIYLGLLLILVQLVRLVVRLVRRGPAEPAVRRMQARIAAVTTGLLTLGLVTYGMTQAFGAPRVVRATIAITDLPPQFEGYRIALVTDLHLGPVLGRGRTQQSVDLVNAEQVDTVALVGDLSDGYPDALADDIAPLGELAVPDGVLFTTGNHEYYSDADAWRRALPGLRVDVLRNTSRAVERDGARLLFAGINDATGETFGDPAELAPALADRRAGDTVVLLAHQPIQVAAASAADVDLQLSGHTHGGQFWPFHLIVQAQQGTLAGLEKVGDTQVFTSRGAGFWGPTIRVGAPPDVSIITLTAA